jgi:hypothetical protein
VCGAARSPHQRGLKPKEITALPAFALTRRRIRGGIYTL